MADLADNAEAQAQLLELYARRIRNRENAADFGEELILVARIIARRI
jgi:hypothetical protein